MVRYRLDSVNDFARKGFSVRVSCRNPRCGHWLICDPAELVLALTTKRVSLRVEVAERYFRCQKCRRRGARIEPSQWGR